MSGKKMLARVGLELMKVNFIMDYFLKWGEKEILKSLVEKNERNRPAGAQEEKYYIVKNLMKGFEKKLKENYLAPYVKEWVFNKLVGEVMLNWKERHPEAAKRRKLEQPLPTFITLSPTQRCNLACKGCYASSSCKTAVTLEWDVVDRIMEQKRRLWGSYFTVVSGGEPLLYESRGKNIFDLFEKYNDNFFLMYTNGTLIDRPTARKLAHLGNVAPAISVEGFEEKTDQRRGQGTYQKLLRAVDYLREEGVLYGISLTATRQNVEQIVSDEFIDFFFEEKDAFFAWMFQYMPIGRGPSFDMMITPRQRRELWFQEQHLIRDKGIFFVDFWNGGPISDGCISAGRRGGYLYIDWYGNVMPCVFVPYTVGNIKEDFFDKGKDLDHVLNTPFFTRLRDWQENYSYKKPALETGNEIVPCPIRDHHCEFHAMVRDETTGARPVDKTAQKAYSDEKFIHDLAEMGGKAAQATNDIWHKQYQKLEQ
ncbi:MAG: radical SAM/SPASM domain-containing protein [Spirochaetota bacterium]